MKQTVIRAKTLFDGHGKKDDITVVVENGKIIDLLKKKIKSDYEGYVTPAIIDAHAHIGMDREGEPYQESETNDTLGQILPLNDPINSIYFDDRAFKDAVDFGVLYCCVVPGSGNVLGGKAKVIRNFARYRDEAVIKDYGYKMALGYNPRSTTDWKGERPNTRMGVYALVEKYFDEILNKKKKADLEKERKIIELDQKKKEKKLSGSEYKREMALIDDEYALEFNEEEKAVLELLSGKKIAKVHVHRDDDVLYLIELVKKYKLNATADHTGDVYFKDTFDKLGKNNIPVVYGPLGSVGYKVELKHAYYQNTQLLMKSKAFFGLMSDHPVIHTVTLRDTLKYFMIFGMKDYEAISLITYKNARILGIDDTLGTVEKGKIASLLVWNEHPLYLGAYPKVVMGEGKILRKR